MRPFRIPSLSVRRSLPLFLAVVVCLATWEVWLTWRLMNQDRNLVAQHTRARLEQIADLAVAQVTEILAGWEFRLSELNSLPPEAGMATLPRNGAYVLLENRSVATYPHKALLFVPAPPPAAPLAAEFEAIGELEFRDQNYPLAIEALRPLTEHPETSAEALLRTARLERKLNHPAAALAAYNRLFRENAVNPDGIPYALLATGGLSEPQPAAGIALRELRAALLEGRWPLRRETFEYYWASVGRLLQLTGGPPKESLEFSILVSGLHEQWERAARNGESFSGRTAEPDEWLLLWHATPSRVAALGAPPGWLDNRLKLPANAVDIRWRWTVSDAPSNAEPHVLRSLADAQLGGKLEFWSSFTARSQALNPLVLALAALFLVLAGAYAMYRGVRRELQAAQLQADFVSAVSHEFRSPLTSLRGIAELLVQDRLADESLRRKSYGFLERETVRLQHLVEDLLDFGRMESRCKQYRIERHDVFGLVRTAVSEFREEALCGGFQVEVNLEPRPATVEGDEEALRRAIRNLLENAVKYSPESRIVWVDGRVNHQEVAISVRDCGMGIEPWEQREVFQKFVRGAAAKRAGIKGTGIGLSMVREIVTAFGGEIRLDSLAGAGSTFTIRLPLAGIEDKQA